MFFKTRFSAILVIAAFASFSSCKKGGDDTPTPTAAFTYKAAYNNNTHAPATVTFTNTSVDGGDYLWNFGDGSTSTDRSPSHKYATAGLFTVSLKATLGSKSNTANQTVNILAAYTRAKVTKFTLNSTTQAFPFNGYFRITDASGGEVYKSPTFSFTGPSFYPPPTPPTLSNLNTIYSIEIWRDAFSDTKLATSPIRLSLYAGGTIPDNSYPTSLAGSNGLSYDLQWE